MPRNEESRPMQGRLFIVSFCLIGVALTWLVPWFQIKPNRIVEGSLASLGSVDPHGAIVLSLCWLFAVSARFLRCSLLVKNRIMVATSVASATIAVLICGNVARNLVGENEVMRVSLSGGLWGMLLLAYAGYALFSDKDSRPWEGRLAGLVFPAFLVIAVFYGTLDKTSVLAEYRVHEEIFWNETLRHVQLSGFAVLLGGLFGVAIGLLASRSRGFRSVVFAILNGIQTVPSLAFFGLMIVPLAALSTAVPLLREWGVGGVGAAPALIALTLYAIFPVARNTATAFSEVPTTILDAGRGMGMSQFQLLVRVELPLSLPLILEGLRTASVQAVGNTVVVAFIGAGGLGSLIFQGLGQYAPDLILLGAIPVLIMALVVDSLWAGAMILWRRPYLKARNA